MKFVSQDLNEHVIARAEQPTEISGLEARILRDKLSGFWESWNISTFFASDEINENINKMPRRLFRLPPPVTRGKTV